MKPLSDEEFENFNEHVKCNWKLCFGGQGLAGRGVCSAGGRWDQKDCPEFIAEDEFLNDWKEKEDEKTKRMATTN